MKWFLLFQIDCLITLIFVEPKCDFNSDNLNAMYVNALLNLFGETISKFYLTVQWTGMMKGAMRVRWGYRQGDIG